MNWVRLLCELEDTESISKVKIRVYGINDSKGFWDQYCELSLLPNFDIINQKKNGALINFMYSYVKNSYWKVPEQGTNFENWIVGD